MAKRTNKNGSSDSKRDSSTNGGAAEGAPRSHDFEQARNRADRLLRDPDAAQRLADRAEQRAEREDGPLKGVINDVRALIRLVRAYVRGDYRAVAWESMVLIVGALVYLVSPLDVIPDFLPGGLVDDAAVVVFVLGLVHEEVADFQTWEQVQAPRPDDTDHQAVVAGD
jgi:uncharacterized membrane protein YkvA (DUF1232 family)